MNSFYLVTRRDAVSVFSVILLVSSKHVLSVLQWRRPEDEAKKDLIFLSFPRIPDQ